MCRWSREPQQWGCPSVLRSASTRARLVQALGHAQLCAAWPVHVLEEESSATTGLAPPPFWAGSLGRRANCARHSPQGRHRHRRSTPPPPHPPSGDPGLWSQGLPGASVHGGPPRGAATLAPGCPGPDPDSAAGGLSSCRRSQAPGPEAAAPKGAPWPNTALCPLQGPTRGEAPSPAQPHETFSWSRRGLDSELCRQSTCPERVLP